jgi:predicted GIY-YIG superfamily endonuclease
LAFFTYIIASRRNGTLYTRSTDNLIKRTRFLHQGAPDQGTVRCRTSTEHQPGFQIRKVDRSFAMATAKQEPLSVCRAFSPHSGISEPSMSDVGASHLSAPDIP